MQTVENNKNKKSVKFQGDMLNFCDFIQVFVFTPNHHLKLQFVGWEEGERGGGRNYGTTIRRILCPPAVPYSVWLEYHRPRRSKNRKVYDYYRIYLKMEHPISRRNDKPCRPSLQSDLALLSA